MPRFFTVSLGVEEVPGTGPAVGIPSCYVVPNYHHLTLTAMKFETTISHPGGHFSETAFYKGGLIRLIIGQRDN